MNEKQKNIAVALGNEKADLVIKNIQIVNVFTRELMDGDVAICNGTITGIGRYTGHTEIDGTGKYICPGLIDSHVHIESSMVAPAEYAKAILPHGTTTIIADPHEIANVCGISGIYYMMNSTDNLPIHIFFMLPSCIPTTAFESNGAELSADMLVQFKVHPRVLGLGEVMDYPAVLEGQSSMLKKLEGFSDRYIDGHGPGLSGYALSAYRTAGIMTDHECSTADEAMERLRLGMTVHIREGSGARNLESILKGLLDANISLDHCTFCTDDKHLEDILHEGHLDHSIRKAVGYGLPVIEAIRMATLNPALCYGLTTLGAVAPGYDANLIILSNLEHFEIDTVLFKGRIVMSDKGIAPFPSPVQEQNVLHTVRVPDIHKEQLSIPLNHNLAWVIEVVPGELLTRKTQAEVSLKDGYFWPTKEYAKLVVIERHKATGRIGAGIVKGFGISNGAMAGTVAHDSHNMIVIGDNDEDMLLAIQELKKSNGGYTLIKQGQVIDTLPLPIAGLMSDLPASSVISQLKRIMQMAHAMGVPTNIDPFVTLSFLALPVIPELRVTDKGLFDVNAFAFIPIQ